MKSKNKQKKRRVEGIAIIALGGAICLSGCNSLYPSRGKFLKFGPTAKEKEVIKQASKDPFPSPGDLKLK